MSAQAWVFMLASWGIISAMTAYCFYKLLTSERQLSGEE